MKSGRSSVVVVRGVNLGAAAEVGLMGPEGVGLALMR